MFETTNREEWLKKRKRYITGTDAPAILGVSPYASAYSVWCRKTGRLPELEQSEYMRIGLAIEQVIADLFVEDTGLQVNTPQPYSLYIAREHEFMAASIDRIIPLRLDDGYTELPLELKNVSAMKSKEWDDGAPPQYIAQLLHQMIVMDAPKGALAALIGGNTFRYLWINRDEYIDLEAHLIEAEREFYRHHLLPDVPPAIDGSDETRNAMKQSIPSDASTSIALPPECMDYDDEIIATKTAIRKLESRKKELENKIMAQLTDCPTGILPNAVWSFKPESRKEHLVKASTSRVLRRKERKESNDD